MNRRVIFMGTPAFAATALRAIHAAGHSIAAVYTQPPRPAGRGHKPQPSAVHQLADELGLVVRHPVSLRKDPAAVAALVADKADVAVVAAYGLILPPAVLAAPRFGCLNIHASLLPRWRGAAPIQRAILAGDSESGISIMQMDAGLDTGPVLLTAATPITDSTTAADLHDRLAAIGADLAVKALAQLESLIPTPQDDSRATHAPKLTRDDGRIDWHTSSPELTRQQRALTPWPGLWCLQAGKRLKVLALSPATGNGAPGQVLDRYLTVALANGAVRLDRVQPENARAMSGADYMNGGSLKLGDRLS